MADEIQRGAESSKCNALLYGHTLGSRALTRLRRESVGRRSPMLKGGRVDTATRALARTYYLRRFDSSCPNKILQTPFVVTSVRDGKKPDSPNTAFGHENLFGQRKAT